jgi:hypothetical protein
VLKSVKPIFSHVPGTFSFSGGKHGLEVFLGDGEQLEGWLAQSVTVPEVSHWFDQ